MMTDDELQEHIDALDSTSRSNLKAHAHAATDENHASFHHIRNWLSGIVGMPVVAGVVWKAVKVGRTLR